MGTPSRSSLSRWEAPACPRPGACQLERRRGSAGPCAACGSTHEGRAPNASLCKVPQPPATLVATTATFLLRKQASSTQGNEDGGSGEKASPPGPRGYKGLDGICFSGTQEGWWWLRDPCSAAPPRPARVGTPSLAGPGGADGSRSWTSSLQCPPQSIYATHVMPLIRSGVSYTQ